MSALWIRINEEQEVGGLQQKVAATFAMKVPGGMIVRTLFVNAGMAMVFVPSPVPEKRKPSEMISGEDMINNWIEASKTDK